MSLSAIIQAWLRQMAQQKAREAAMDAIHREATRQSSSGEAFNQDSTVPPADLPPCHVGLIFAMGIEGAAFEERISGLIRIQGSKFTAKQGGLHGRGIALTYSDVGRQNAAHAAELLISGHNPKWLVSAGLAGGLQPQLRRGDFVMADAIVNESGERLAIDLALSPQTQTATAGLHIGPLLTADRVIVKPEEKRQLGQRHGALAVDMETWGIAEVCRQAKQRFLSVRIISDSVDDELPTEIERLVKKKGTARRIGAAAGSIVRRPSTVKDLWRFRSTALQCAERLAKFLEGVVEQLGD